MKFLRLVATLIPLVFFSSCTDRGATNQPPVGGITDSEDSTRTSPKVKSVEASTSIPVTVRQQIERLRSGRATDRAHAAMALAELGKDAEAAIPLLMSMLTDDTKLQWKSTSGGRGEVTTPGREAAIAVGRISGTNASQLLEILDENRMALLSEKDAETIVDRRNRVRNSIVGLGYTQDQRAAIKLLSHLDEEPGLVAVALGRIGDPRAIQPLIDKLRMINRDVKEEKSLAWSVQREIVEGLSHFRDSGTVEVLVEAINVAGQGPAVKTAAEALGEIGDRRAVDVLIGLLGTEATPEAVAALGKIGDRRAIEPLIGVLENDWADWVKDSAGHSLRSLTGKKLPPDPEAWRQWVNQSGGLK